MISSLIENISPLLSAGFFVSLRLFVNITKKSKPVNDSSTSSTAEIAAHGHVLTPGRYVGAEEVEDEGDPFEEKMPCLVAELHAQFSSLLPPWERLGEGACISAKLESAIRQNLKGLGYGF